MAWFVERLAPNGEMDYKVLGKNGIYEDFGNFNYGAMALAFGFSENAALRMAGLVQEFVNTKYKLKRSGMIDAFSYGLSHSMEFLGPPPHGDQKRDQEMIKQGFRYVREVFVQKYTIGEIRRDLNRVREAVEAEEWESVRRFPSRINNVLH